MNTKKIFQELLELVNNTRLEYVYELQEEYSQKDIESAIMINPIPEEIISIYSCVGGEYSAKNCFSGLIPAYDLIQLESINRVINMFQDIRSERINRYGNNDEDICGTPLSWKPDMVPFLCDGAGYYIFFRTLLNDRSIWLYPKVGSIRKINTSIDRFILTAIECYRQGAYYLDEDDEMWDTDAVLYREIVKSIDPEIENCSPP
jgi:hypothetical protein